MLEESVSLSLQSYESLYWDEWPMVTIYQYTKLRHFYIAFWSSPELW